MEFKKIIIINWNNENSIKRAEYNKTRAENSGYKLALAIGGLNTSKLIYTKNI